MSISKLISHNSPDDLPAFKTVVETIHERINNVGSSNVSTQQKLRILDELSQFDLGRYLLQHQGLNGYWTHYILTYPWFGRETRKNNCGEPLSKLEVFLLEKAPAIIATQQRFQIFLKETQKYVADHAVLASIPCGLMGELLYLNFEKIHSIRLVGVDYDSNALKDATILANKLYLSKFIKLFQRDAWQLDFQNEFDVITSNGLNLYEPNDDKVVKLYQQFYSALKNGGKLITSFLTYPAALTNYCEWDLEKVDQDDLLLQDIIFREIFLARWQYFHSTEQTKDQLISAGFKNIQIIYDEAKLFPTVIATK